jgi:DNA-binding HxlR family transcriptional regulator
VRHEHLLTQKGWELADILLAIGAWGDRWTAGEAGPPFSTATAPAGT